MANPMPLRSSLNAVALAVKAQIMTKTGLDTNRVRIIARTRKPPELVGDQDILLRDRGIHSVDSGNSDRHDCRIWRKFGITIRTRLLLDQSGSDEIWETHATAGNIVAEETVIDALQNFLPENSNRDTLLFEPMKLIGGAQREKEGLDWGEVEVFFQAGIQLPLDQSWA